MPLNIDSDRGCKSNCKQDLVNGRLPGVRGSIGAEGEGGGAEEVLSHAQAVDVHFLGLVVLVIEQTVVVECLLVKLIADIEIGLAHAPGEDGHYMAEGVLQ